MKVEYSNRALADLRKLSAGSQAAFGHRVAAASRGGQLNLPKPLLKFIIRCVAPAGPCYS